MPKPEHTGLRAYRLNDPTNALERLFAEAWAEENDPPQWLRAGLPVLESIMCPTTDAQYALDDRDRQVAASVVQWLGTHCGRSFVRGVLEKAGWTVVEGSNQPTQNRTGKERR